MGSVWSMSASFTPFNQRWNRRAIPLWLTYNTLFDFIVSLMYSSIVQLGISAANAIIFIVVLQWSAFKIYNYNFQFFLHCLQSGISFLVRYCRTGTLHLGLWYNFAKMYFCVCTDNQSNKEIFVCSIFVISRKFSKMQKFPVLQHPYRLFGL